MKSREVSQTIVSRQTRAEQDPELSCGCFGKQGMKRNVERMSSGCKDKLWLNVAGSGVSEEPWASG